ncbi:12801_t:CDS:1, partial [Acaulospora morrowiae]
MSENHNSQSGYRPSFPPSITTNEIVKTHLKKGLGNTNRTLNAFLIYRLAYNREASEHNLGNISKRA